jgi:hypothetical protein
MIALVCFTVFMTRDAKSPKLLDVYGVTSYEKLK